MNVFSLSFALLAYLAISHAFAQTSPQQEPDTLPIVRDLPGLPGHAFAVLNHASGAAPREVEKNDEAQRTTITRMFAPFDTLDIGGTTVTLDTEGRDNATRLPDLARLWGSTRAHGEGEVMYSAACWDSRPAGLRAIMASSLSPDQRINGWVIAQDNTPASQTCATTDRLTPPTMPAGLQLGMERTAVLHALSLPPTAQNVRQLTWAYTVFQSDDSAIDYQLDAWFTDGRLSALRYHTLHTN